MYLWRSLELQRYFDVNELLTPAIAKNIYDECSEKLQGKEFRVHNLLRKMNVQYVGATDDPLDDLFAHQKIHNSKFEIKVYSSFRPDKAMHIDNATTFNEYILKLEAVTETTIESFDDYVAVLKNRHDYFVANGCTVSDHGLDEMYAEDYTEKELKTLFENVRKGYQSPQYRNSNGDRLGIFFKKAGASKGASEVVYDLAGASIADVDAFEFDFDKILASAD